MTNQDFRRKALVAFVEMKAEELDIAAKNGVLTSEMVSDIVAEIRVRLDALARVPAFQPANEN